LFDHKNIRTLTTFVEEYQVCISLPVVLGASGIDKVLNVEWNEVEKNNFEQSIEVLKEVIFRYSDKLN
jgi:malate/lactate dehydrogenase